MQSFFTRSFPVLVTLFLLLATPVLAASGIQVIGINPSGVDVPSGQEVVINFNRPMVAVGRMERTPEEIPVVIEPPLACQWRWLSTSSLACQLNEKNPMLPATTYRLEIKPGLKAHDGAVMKTGVVHSFSTVRPRVSGQSFESWLSPVHPQIRVWFNQPVTKKSVEAHLYFRTGDGRRVAAAVVEDAGRKKKKKKKGAVQPKLPHDARYWFVEPKEDFTADAHVELRVENGVVPLQGKEAGKEDRTIVAFDTFPPFSFHGIRCRNNMNVELTIRPGQEQGLGALCNPLDEISLLFSTPVINKELKDHVKLTPDLAGGRKDYDPWENAGSYSRLSSPHTRGHLYASPLPEMLKANATYKLSIAGGKLRDEFGRPLAGGSTMAFATDHRKPNFVLDRHYSVLEKKVDSDVPLVVTNLAQVNVKYSAVDGKGKVRRGEELLEVAPALDISYPMPLKVRDMLKAPSGVVTGEVHTAPPLSEKTAEDRWFFSQVTPFNVQIKVGHYNTLVWVTDFGTGLPVAGVSVDVYRGKPADIVPPRKTFHKAQTDDRGIAMLPGTEKLDPDLRLLGYFGEEKERLFIRCRKGSDIALVPLIDEFSARYMGEDEESSSYLQQRYQHIHAWGMTAQGLYKVGDTVQFKLYVRDQDNRAFVLPPLKGYSLQVVDPMGKVVHERKNLTLSEFGAFDGSFPIPANGAVGWYRFLLSAKYRKGEWEPMQVLVSDFTPAPFRVTTELNGTLFREGDQVKAATLAKLHAGGPYASGRARVTVQLRPQPFASDDPRAKGYTFDSFSPEGRGVQQLLQTEGAVNVQGELATTFVLEPNDVLYGRIEVESAVRDDRGKFVASSASASFVGRDRFVGLLQPDWVLKAGEPARVLALVVDEQGKVAPGTPVKVTVEYRKTVASRVKGAGNAYLTHFEHQWEKAGQCQAVSAAEGFECTFTPEHPGLHRINATITDTRGKEHSTRLDRWTAGKGQVIWDGEQNNSLTVIPEKKEYRVGDTARFLVQNPFPGATALVTVERYGVMKSWIEKLPEASATIEYQVEPDAVPGFHLSVVVVSPRVQKPLGKNRVDLGKPSFRMGYVPVRVKDPYKELKVEVLPQKQLYKPKETAGLDLRAYGRTGDPQGKQPPMELAVAVLDEAVFDLIKGGRDYFDVYKGFYYLDPLDIKNFSILMQLVGRQKFEKKGANAGGDGGPDLSMRSTFKFVSYWNPSLKTDENGRAHVEFPLPDNLTGWRVLVMAVTAGDLMGLGEGSFAVSTPVEIRPVMPNQLKEGDSVAAGFTVMNRTGKERALEVEITAKGALATAGGGKVTVRQQVLAQPFARNRVTIPVTSRGSGAITFTARAFDKEDGDEVQHVLPVLKRQSLHSAATYGSTTAAEVTEEIAIPADIRTDAGRVGVSLAPTVIGNLEGSFRYMKEYPYSCWEQKLTKAVMAARYQQLKSYLPPELEWPESKALPDATLGLAAEHQAPSGAMAFYVASDTFASPYLSAYTALAFNWLRAGGYKVPEQVEQKLHSYLLNLLRNNAMPSFYSKGMASTVRAVALAALAPSGKISAADLKRYRGHLPEMSLFGKAHYLQALLKVKGTRELQAETARMILAQGSETGGKYLFSETLDADYRQILTSTTRDNAAALTALLGYAQTAEGAKIVGDIPAKVVRSITRTRGSRDHWENTQENLFVLNALNEYRRLYEQKAPAMTVTAAFAGERLGSGRFGDVRDKALELERGLRADDAGKKGTVRIGREGTGRLYYAARLSYSPKEIAKDPVNAGIELRREYSVERGGKWVLLESPLKLKSGELVRVDLYVSLRAARNFVVVDDPVPGGLEPVNRDLATASTVDAGKGEMKRPKGSFWFNFKDWIEYGFSYGTFYHKELRHHAARFYSEYLPAGNYHLSYVAQTIAPGEFTILPAHAEEMYEPDVFGKSAPALLRVE